MIEKEGIISNLKELGMPICTVSEFKNVLSLVVEKWIWSSNFTDVFPNIHFIFFFLENKILTLLSLPKM